MLRPEGHRPAPRVNRSSAVGPPITTTHDDDSITARQGSSNRRVKDVRADEHQGGTGPGRHRGGIANADVHPGRRPEPDHIVEQQWIAREQEGP